MKFYIASPFFNERQIEIVEQIKEMLTCKGFEFFSPKDDCLFENDKGMDSKRIFEINCEQIEKCDGIIVVTDFADRGTMWEAGRAFGMGNVVYVWVDYIEGQNFNIMLAHSADAIAKGLPELSDILDETKKTGAVPSRVYKGVME